MVGISSEGLKYGIKNVSFSPDFKIGTSNEVLQSKVKIELSGSGMIIILPIKSFDKIVKFMKSYQHSITFTAKPPFDVSLYFSIISFPVSNIVLIQASKLTR